MDPLKTPKPPSPDEAKPNLDSFATPVTLKDHRDTTAAFEYTRKQTQVPNRASWKR